MLATLWQQAHKKSPTFHLSVFIFHSRSLAHFPHRGLYCQSSFDGSHVCVFVCLKQGSSGGSRLFCFALGCGAGERTDVCVFNPFKWSGFEVQGSCFDLFFPCLACWCYYDFDRGEMKNKEQGKRMQKRSHATFPLL